MSYALRNTLILGVLLALMCAAGAYWVWWRQAAQIQTLKAQEKTLRTDLDNINAVLSIYDTTLAELNRLKARLKTRNQIVPALDSPTQTLSYLYEIQRLPGASVAFDFQYIETTNPGKYSVNKYSLEGEGRFENLYAFVWYVENGRRFYSVDHLEVESHRESAGGPVDPRGVVDFRMVFRGYFEPKSRVEDVGAPEASVHPGLLKINPFRPLIVEVLPQNREGLFEVDGARLRGLTPKVAYLVDKTGQPHLLREGDRVFLGRLEKIDIERNRVAFVLNKGGIWEHPTLAIDLSNE